MSPPDATRGAPDWLAVHEEDGELRFRVGRAGDDVVAEWNGLARLTARRDGSSHELVFFAGVSAAERRKLERGAAHLLLRQLHGKLALHGSAVAFGERALVLLGGSGQGKSTLAAALCRSGAALVADDAAAIDVLDREAVIVPTETDHWLDDAALSALGLVRARDVEAHRKAKAAIPALALRSEPARIAAIVTLEWSSSTSLTRVRSGEAVARVLPHIVRFVLDDPNIHRTELDAIHDLIVATDVYVLERPRELLGLAATVDTLSALCLKEDEVLR